MEGCRGRGLPREIMRRSTETACLVVGGGCFDKPERRLGGSMMGSAGWKIARRCVKRLSAVGIRLGPILCSLALLGTACVAVVGPPNAPPAGQVWVETGGQWVLVPVPPSEGPYRWVGSGWPIRRRLLLGANGCRDIGDLADG